MESGVTFFFLPPWPGRGGILQGSWGFGLRRIEQKLSTRLCLKGGSFFSDPLLLKSQVLGVLRNVLFLCIIQIYRLSLD